MAAFGYALSSEEHAPNELVRLARRAEDVGFTFALISDHYHAWIDRQGHSPFVWGVIGGIAQATKRLMVGTGVTCPTIRIPSRHHCSSGGDIGGEDVAQAIICGPDPERHIAGIKEFVDAGYDHVYVRQIGPDQEGFFRFYEREVLPKF